MGLCGAIGRVALLALLASHALAGGTTVAGVDFGSAFIKVSYVAPGEAELLPIALNDMSERKTANVLAFRGDSAFVGPHALKPVLNVPERGFAWVQPLLGVAWEDAGVQEHTLPFRTTGLARDAESGGVAAVCAASGAESADDAARTRPAVHLAGIVLGKVAKDTEAHAGRRLRDVVLTVPPHWGSARRAALLDAAAVAGVSVAGTITDVGAAALYYGVVASARDAEARTVVLVDVGATHAAAAVVRIDPAHAEAPGARPSVLVDLLRVVSDEGVCGRDIDRAVAGVLARRFAEANGSPTDAPLTAIVPPGKALNRLLAEATRVKEVLSANTEIRASVDELVGSASLPPTVVTRAELEDACAHMRGRVSALVRSALSAAGVSDFSAVVPIGGSSRVPFVLAELRSAFGDARVATVLNMDEAVAQGAALYAASLAGFRVRPLRFRDAWSRTVTLRHVSGVAAEGLKPDASLPGALGPEASAVDVLAVGSAVGAHRAVTLRDAADVAGVVLEDGVPLYALSVRGARAAAEAFVASAPGRTLVSARTKLWVDLSPRGAFAALRDAPVVLVEYTEPAPASPEASPDASTTAPDTQSASPTSDAQSAPTDAPRGDESRGEKTKTEVVRLKEYVFAPLFVHSPPKTVALLAAAMREERDAEARAAARASLFNDLEASTYRLRDLLGEDSDGPNGFREYADDAMRTALAASVARASDAIDNDDGTVEHEHILRTARSGLESAENAVLERIAEHAERPQRAAALRSEASAAIEWVARMRTEQPDPSARPFSDAELANVVATAQAALAWLADAEKRQAALALSAQPVLPCDDIRARTKTIVDARMALVARPPVDRPTASPIEAADDSVDMDSSKTAGDVNEGPAEEAKAADEQQPTNEHDEL